MPDAWFEGLTLRRWKLHNFKSVQNADVELAPLTVVVGANSAGKSTLLQSIRAAAQAANSPGQAFPLNGEQIRLGTYKETKWAGADAEDGQSIGIEGCFVRGSEDEASIRLPARRPARYGRWRFGHRYAKIDWSVSLRGALANQTALTMIDEIEVHAQIDDDEPSEIIAKSAAASPKPFTFGNEAAYVGSMVEEGSPTPDLVDIEIRGAFPRRVLYRAKLASNLVDLWWVAQQRNSFGIPGRFPKGNETTEQVTNSQAVSVIVGDISGVLDQIGIDAALDYRAERRILVAFRELVGSRPPLVLTWGPDLYSLAAEAVQLKVGDRVAAREMDVPDSIKDYCDMVRDFLAHSVQHLGPLRFDPQVVYTTAPIASPGFIGAKGEYSAAVLQASGRTNVEVPLPNQLDQGNQSIQLQAAVNLWAAHLGIASSFATNDRGRLGLELSLRQPDLDLSLDLTSVGTGVSQLLPVLVMCLQAPPGSLLLIEQPELHLNPAVQQRLADFLLAIASSGRQLIVETHSEHLVARLRLRTVEDVTGTNHDRIAVVFAERAEGRTTYRTVKPDVDGSMASWPAGFFDEAATESENLLRAMIEYRHRNPGTPTS